MKLVRILAILPLALISLMNVGYYFGTEPKPDVALAIAVGAMGLAGFVAAYGLARDVSWGIPAAIAVAGVNVAAAVIGFAADVEGAVIGLAISALALALAGAAAPSRRKVSVA